MKQLVLIHGALGSGEEFNQLLPFLENHFHVHIYEIPGHGAKSEAIHDFNIDAITRDLKNYLSTIGNSYIFGFSLGGYLAIHLSLTYPQHILGIVTLGTKFNWSPEIADHEKKSLNSSFLEQKVPPFFEYLQQLHGEHLDRLFTATAEFMTDLGAHPKLTDRTVRNVNIPIQITRGGKDRMVTPEESLVISKALKKGSYFEIPSFIHPLGFLKKKHVAEHIRTQLNALDYSYASTSFGQIAYQQIGAIENQHELILLFLHEALGSIAQWKGFPAILSKELGLSALVPEMLGYGFSDSLPGKRTSNYLHEFAWKHLPAFLDALGIQNKLLLVGHSDGGTEALLFASKYPERIHGVITMAAHIENEPETRAGIHPAIKAYEEGKLSGLEIYHGARTHEVFYAWADTWLSDSFEKWSIENDMTTGDFPALIIQGQDDQYGTEQQVHKIIHRLGHQATPSFIPNCGHSPHLEQQSMVIQLIRQWNKQ